MQRKWILLAAGASDWYNAYRLYGEARRVG